MIVRGMLAVLDHNFNIGRKPVCEGQRFFKSLKKWVYVPIYETKSNQWIKNLISSICLYVEQQFNITTKIKNEHAGPIPKTIASVVQPTLEEKNDNIL